MKFLILNGPNLNLMRWSEPGVPGELDYNAIMDYVQAGCEQLGIETDCCQSNHEGDLVDEIQAAAGRVDGIVLNPGAYAHYSVAILDALRLCGSKSGREINKVEATGLTPCYYEKAPYFEEAKLVLVCRKVAVSAFEPSQFLDSGIMQNYAQNDFHAIYYGAIEKVLISE